MKLKSIKIRNVQNIFKRGYSDTSNESYNHIPVLKEEMLQKLNIKNESDKIYLDLTFGFGGYTKSILDNYDKVKVVAMDQDPLAYVRAYKMSLLPKYKDRLIPILGKFGQVQQHIDFINELNKELKKSTNLTQFDGIVMDIGVSSGQLDDALLGFSYSKSGRLDMRMCQLDSDTENQINSLGKASQLMLSLHKKLYVNKTITAHQIVNNYSYEQLCDIIYKYGEEKFYKRIAQAIIEYRNNEVIDTTTQLSDIILKVCPKHLRPNKWNAFGALFNAPHPAARTFQSLRIYINQELDELQKALDSTIELLKPESRLVAISFHSLEDRIVKKFLQTHIQVITNVSSGEESISIQQLKRKRKSEHRNKLKSLLYEDFEKIDKIQNQELQYQNPLFKLDVSKSKALILPTKEEIENNSRSRSAKLRYAIRTEF